MFKPRQDVELLLRRDWGTNVPYKLEFSTEKGHFLVATQDLKQGELILEETPYVRAPLNEKCCLACFAHCADKCAICNQYLCKSDDCKNSTEHQLECQILAGKNLPPIEPSVILVLRVLRLQTPDFGLLLSNLEKFKSDPEWMQKRKRHVDFIQKLEMPGVDQDSILAILAIDATNGQTGEFGGCKVRMIHPLGSLMSHDCCPNVIRYVSGVKHGNYLQCRASTDISKGQTLTISYINPITPTQMRQIILKKDYFFDCKCHRCHDIDTDGGSLLCPTCLEPLESKTWLCRKCNAHLERSEAIEIVKKAYRESQNLLENPNQWHIDTFETFLSNFSQKLHVNHLTNVAVKSKLVGFYGKEPGYTLGEMSKEMLQKKLKYGQDCLEVLKKIQPGLSSAKGVLYYELHLPMFLLAQQDLDNAETNMAQEEAKAKINEAFQFLEESINLLQFEQEGTFEHSLCIGTAVGLLRRGYPIPKAIFTQLGDLRNTLWS